MREPVLHFLLIGAALFVYYDLVATPGPDAERIVVSRALVDALAREHSVRWNRPPTPAELQGLVDTYVRDEILYREGLALGLDRDDPVIKRRVRQKIEIIAEEQLAREPPQEAELAAYLERHAGRFTRPGIVSFEQLLLPESATAAQIATALRAVQRGADPAQVGVPTMLPERALDAPLDLVARDFGTEFADGLAGLPRNEWAGPVRSGFGAHLVRVTTASPPVVPTLAEARATVTREWENERRLASLAEAYRQLRSRYDVVIEAELSPAAAP